MNLIVVGLALFVVRPMRRSISAAQDKSSRWASWQSELAIGSGLERAREGAPFLFGAAVHKSSVA